MYICICNGLTERQVDDAISSGAQSACGVYKHHGCAAQCGKCVGEVKERLQSRCASGAAGTATHLPMAPEE